MAGAMVKNAPCGSVDRNNEESRKPFGLRPSLFLAAIYSRGTCCPTTIDVLMFHFRVRNGTGWGHQAMTTRLQEAFLLSACPVIIFAALVYFSGQTDIRVA